MRQLARMPEDLPRGTLTSLNTIKHGSRAKTLLLRHEDPNQWLRLHQTYVDEYDPQTPFFEELLDEAVRMHWFLKRNQNNLYLVQVDLPEDPRLWNAEDHHQIALFTRYQTAAERSFHRALARLQSHHKAQRKIEEVKTQKAPKAPKKEVVVDPAVIEQWVEVHKIENKVVTEFYPPNDELAQMIEESDPKPTLVYRRLFFPNGVPDHYQWTNPRKGQATNGGLAIQRMTVETWLGIREKERETGHAESTGKVTLRDWRDGDPADLS